MDKSHFTPGIEHLFQLFVRAFTQTESAERTSAS